MSPRRASIRRRGAISGIRSAAIPRKASPRSYPRITWTKPCSAIPSPTSPMARSCSTRRPRTFPSKIGLSCWRIAGRPLQAAQAMLEGAPGVDLVARFGAEIHVCGHDAAALARAAARVKEAQPHVTIEQIEAGFEEIFIYLMSGSRGQFPMKLPRLPILRSFLGARVRRVPQGTGADAARPADLRDHDHDAGHAARAVRLRHQHRSAPSARGGRDARGRAADARVPRSSLRASTFIDIVAVVSQRRRRRTQCCARARRASSSPSPRVSSAALCAASARKS